MTVETRTLENPQKPKFIAALIFGSRWLQVPFYLGLIVAQVVYVVLFGKELIHLIQGATTLSEQLIMLAVLGLIDVVMISNLHGNYRHQLDSLAQNLYRDRRSGRAGFQLHRRRRHVANDYSCRVYSVGDWYCVHRYLDASGQAETLSQRLRSGQAQIAAAQLRGEPNH
jgi:Uncharacterized protein family, UPF0114